ncbi:hypothetical protein CBL_10515 [Carabus blaptoides fortunei]
MVLISALTVWRASDETEPGAQSGHGHHLQQRFINYPIKQWAASSKPGSSSTEMQTCSSCWTLNSTNHDSGGSKLRQRRPVNWVDNDQEEYESDLIEFILEIGCG